MATGAGHIRGGSRASRRNALYPTVLDIGWVPAFIGINASLDEPFKVGVVYMTYIMVTLWVVHIDWRC